MRQYFTAQYSNVVSEIGSGGRPTEQRTGLLITRCLELSFRWALLQLTMVTMAGSIIIILATIWTNNRW